MSEYYYNQRSKELHEIILDRDGSFTEFLAECDPLGRMITWERDYASPEFNPYKKPSDFFEEELKAHCSGGDLLHSISSGLVYGLLVNRDDPEHVFIESLKDDFKLSIGNEDQFQKIRSGIEDLPSQEFNALCNEVAKCGGAFDRILQSDMLILPVYVRGDDVIEYCTDPDVDSTKCGYIFVEDWLKTGLSKNAIYERMIQKVKDYTAWSQELGAEIYIYNLSMDDYKNHFENGFVFDSDDYIEKLQDDGIRSLGEYENLNACLDDNVGVLPTADSQERYVTGRLQEEISGTLEKLNLKCSDSCLSYIAEALVSESRYKGKEDIEL